MQWGAGRENFDDDHEQAVSVGLQSAADPRMGGGPGMDWRRTAGIGIACLAMLHWFFGLWPALATYRLDAFPGRVVLLAPSGPLLRLWFVGGILLVCASGFLAWQRRSSQTLPAPWARIQERLTWLPVLVLGARLLQAHGPVLSGNLLYYGASAIMAWALLGGYAPAADGPPGRGASRRTWWLVTLLFTCLYWLAGWYFTASVGEHSGDEGHYLIQAHSLYYDHDLDIRNDLGNPRSVDPEYMHVSTNSREGHWYSVHTPGLAFLLAPTVPFGWPVRHLVLGLLSGLGLAGFYSLCLRLGRDRATALVLLCLLGLSALWGIYSCRALPEVLGAALTVCGVLAVLNQAERPRSSLLLLLFLIAALPFANIRFVPIALALGCCYGLFTLLAPCPWRMKIFRLVLLAAGSGLALSAFLCFQAHLFGWHLGLAHKPQNLEFSPLFAWNALASARGILAAYPLFACALPAGLVLLFRRNHWRYGLIATLVFLAVFLTWSSSNMFTGGSALPGRFLVVVVPVVTAALAALLPGANGAFRWLAFYLALFSVTMFLTALVVLPDLHNQFAAPLDVDLVQPLFTHLLRILYDPYETIQWWPALLGYGGAALLLLRPAWSRRAQCGALAVLGAGVIALAHPGPKVGAPCYTERLWQLDPVAVYGDHQRTCPLWQGLAPHLWTTPKISNRAAAPAHADNVIAYRELGCNDWDQRDYRWATLVRPFPARRGWRVLSLAAQLEGDAAAEFVIREGAHTLVSKKYLPHAAIRDVFTFQTYQRGLLYILIRLEGREGSLQTGVLGISAFDPAFQKQADLTLPTAMDIPAPR